MGDTRKSGADAAMARDDKAVTGGAQTSDRTAPATSLPTATADVGRPAGSLLHLQRTAGNHAVTALLSSRPLAIQRHHGPRHTPSDVGTLPIDGLLRMARRGGEAQRTGLTRVVLAAIDAQVRDAVARGKSADVRRLIAVDPELAANPTLRQRMQRLLPATDPAATPEDDALVPAFSQGEFDTCGAASLLTALVAFDRSSEDKARLNRHVLAVCAVILRHASVLSPALRDETVAYTRGVRDRVSQRGPQASLTEREYQILAVHLYNIARAQRSPGQRTSSGLATEEIATIVTNLNRELNGPRAAPAQVQHAIEALDPDFASFVLSSLVAELSPGAAAQVHWYVNSGGLPQPHAVLIGRTPSGRLWYFNDQGLSPSFRRTAGSLEVLLRRVTAANGYWLLSTVRVSQIRQLFTNPRALAVHGPWEPPAVVAAPR